MPIMSSGTTQQSAWGSLEHKVYMMDFRRFSEQRRPCSMPHSSHSTSDDWLVVNMLRFPTSAYTAEHSKTMVWSETPPQRPHAFRIIGSGPTCFKQKAVVLLTARYLSLLVTPIFTKSFSMKGSSHRRSCHHRFVLEGLWNTRAALAERLNVTQACKELALCNLGFTEPWLSPVPLCKESL